MNNEATIKVEIGNMEDGQIAGLCHFAKTYSTFGVKQTKGVCILFSDNNGDEFPGPRITTNTIWLKSSWGLDGVSQYAYSLDGKFFIPFGTPYQLTWGNYRGDRIGIFCYNTLREKGYIDVDWFHYKY